MYHLNKHNTQTGSMPDQVRQEMMYEMILNISFNTQYLQFGGHFGPPSWISKFIF